MTNTEDTNSPRERRGKVAILIDEYDLQGIGTELEQLWTADEDRRSLRELADHFNRRLLQQALNEANIQTLDGEVENSYRLLTDEDVTDADRTRIRRRLERDGVDVDALLDDFVTYQSIRTFLQKHRGAKYAPDTKDPLEREAETIRQLRGRVVSVTEGAIDRLRNSDQLTLGEFRTLVDVQVVCEECNTQYDVDELCERGGCDCEE